MPEPVDVVELTTFAQVRDALRSKDLKQAMYDDGAVVMADCLLTLHGSEHRDRRRLENRLFRREVFANWERNVLVDTMDSTLAPFVAAGRGDLTVIGYRSAMNMTALIAGIDHDPSDTEATEKLYATVKKLSEGATLVHSTRDKAQVRREVRAAMDEFRVELFQPSLARRRHLVDQADAGELDHDQLPDDVLTTLLRNDDRLQLPDDVVFREICFYLQAGAHSTANAFTHTVHDLFQWLAAHPQHHSAATTDVAFVQRCMHESLRLHPASPVAWRTAVVDVTLNDGVLLGAGSRVVLDLMAANRDPQVFGSDAAVFDPYRDPVAGVTPWGHSFGGGRHACIGAELDGGLEPGSTPSGSDHLYGTVAVITQAFIDAGGRPDPLNEPSLDPTSVRRHFSSYPVVFS